MKFYIYKGSRPSEGAVNLKNALGATLMRSEGSAYRGRQGTAVINWGCINAEAQRIEELAPTVFNKVESIKLAANKRSFFENLFLKEPAITIPFTDSYDNAVAILNNGGRIFARTELNGHSGSGIVLLHNGTDTPQAVRRVKDAGQIPVLNVNHDRIPNNVLSCRLFTQGIIGKRNEFRVHVAFGKVILVQVKLKKEGYGENPLANTIVRNLSGGWIYGVNTAAETEGYAEVQAAAIKAVAATGLDFGAVDMVFKVDTKQAYVLEINTAPGLAEDGSALEAYTAAFKEQE